MDFNRQHLIRSTQRYRTRWSSSLNDYRLDLIVAARVTIRHIHLSHGHAGDKYIALGGGEKRRSIPLSYNTESHTPPELRQLRPCTPARRISLSTNVSVWQAKCAKRRMRKNHYSKGRWPETAPEDLGTADADADADEPSMKAEMSDSATFSFFLFLCFTAIQLRLRNLDYMSSFWSRQVDVYRSRSHWLWYLAYTRLQAWGCV